MLAYPQSPPHAFVYVYLTREMESGEGEGGEKRENERDIKTSLDEIIT